MEILSIFTLLLDIRLAKRVKTFLQNFKDGYQEALKDISGFIEVWCGFP